MLVFMCFVCSLFHFGTYCESKLHTRSSLQEERPELNRGTVDYVAARPEFDQICQLVMLLQ